MGMKMKSVMRNTAPETTPNPSGLGMHENVMTYVVRYIWKTYTLSPEVLFRSLPYRLALMKLSRIALDAIKLSARK